MTPQEKIMDIDGQILDAAKEMSKRLHGKPSSFKSGIDFRKHVYALCEQRSIAEVEAELDEAMHEWRKHLDGEPSQFESREQYTAVKNELCSQLVILQRQ